MVQSPCVKVCRINPQTMLCEGCGRTLNEIQKWLKMPEADRQHTLDLLAERRKAGWVPHN